MLRWFLAQHLPTYSFTVSPEKKTASEKKKKGKGTPKDNHKLKSKDDEDTLPVFGPSVDEEPVFEAPSTPPPANKTDGGVAAPPPTFTPSIKKTLAKPGKGSAPVPLPAGLTTADLKSRLDGKKKIKWVFQASMLCCCLVTLFQRSILDPTRNARSDRAMAAIS